VGTDALDYLVIGAGPAGTQLAYFLHQAGRDYLVVEAGESAGSTFRTFPRHRQMISINKPHTGSDDPELNLRMDWNSLLSDDPDTRFTSYTGRFFPHADDYVRYLTDFAAAHQLKIRYDTRITRLERSGDFVATGSDGTRFTARRVVVATGFGRPYVPDIPGIETTERYWDVSVDPAEFTDQRVLIIGKGNSAFETADNLNEHAARIHVLGPNALKFAWRTHFIGHLRAVNNNFLDTYQLKTQNMVLDATIQRIERRADEYHVTLTYARRPKTVTLVYDRVITCTGFALDDTIFGAGARPELAINDRFPRLTPEWESVNVPDLFFAGTLTQVRDFKRYTSAFIHGFRYGVRALSRVLARRYEEQPWPSRELPADPPAVADALLERLNHTSGLWQQFGFLCDFVAIAAGSSIARYYEEMPFDLLHEPDYGAAQDVVTVSLEYGAGHSLIDPFDVEAGRAWEADPSNEDRYLHPVVRHYRAGELVATCHLPEHIYNEWTDEDEYRRPLREFVARVLGVPAVPERTNRSSHTVTLEQPLVNVREFEQAARERLDPVHHDYFAGGAQDERTVAANESAFASINLVPRILRGAGPPALGVTLLGCESSMPVLMAPTAFHRLAHPQAELATVRAAARADVIMTVAMLSTVAVARIAEEARGVLGDTDPKLWFQLYPQPDQEFTRALVRRAEAAGCRALVVTADSAALGRHERNDRNDFHQLPAGIRCENLRGLGGSDSGDVRRVTLSPEISWRHLESLREMTRLPIVLKGVLHPADARLAVEHGMDAIVVSNHGGRQLDTTPASIAQLPALADAVTGRIPILLDGGVRRGTDVVKALALGADAVAVGRPIVWGLAAGGEDGVTTVLDLIRSELDNALTLCGVSTPKEISRDLVRLPAEASC
jgi:isopentenyl diphosphate isomerase/L-lactate dehydrogenase-like FMN-dependent dehydrogenase/thioredoxin reductase